MFKNITNSSKIIWFLGVVAITITTIVSTKINLLSITTLVGGVLGFSSVVYIVNRNWFAGVSGLLSAIIYIILAVIAHNPSDAILNALFIAVLDLPIIFSKEWKNDSKPKGLDWSNGGLLLLIWLISFLFLMFIEIKLGMPRVIWSPLAGSLGVTAAVSTSFMRVKQGFFIWSAQNIIQVILWSITAYQGDSSWVLAITYLFYTINASSSFFNGKWFK